MKVTKIAIAVATILLVAACNKNEIRIGGKFIGLNANMVYLEKMSPSGESIIDSVQLTKDGSYRFVVKDAAFTPTLYNLLYNGDRIPLLLSRGEDVEVGALGNALANYTVSGSKESELLREFNREYLNGQLALRELLSRYHNASESDRKKLTEQYNDTYRDIKRKQISFIVENKEYVASVYALYQRLPGEQHLSSAESDIIYYRAVSDGLSKTRPASPFLLRVNNDIARMEAQASLLKTIEARTFPELNGVDMYGNKIALSSLEGNIILIDFWSAELGNSNAFNAELKEIYEEYYDKGFRVYQVSADTSKAQWIRTVQEQRLPWISVCDFLAEDSPMLRAYNIRKLPSNYLIDRQGNIIGKDLYSDALAEKLKSVINK